MIEERRTRITEEILVSPGGGLDSKDHPVGATGLGQLAEII